MRQFFPQIEDFPTDNSVPTAELFFRGTNSTGLLEKQLHDGLVSVLLFAGGSAGYRLYA